MNFIPSLFGKSDPQAQLRKCKELLRSNARQLDRQTANLKQQETKAKNLILKADKRAALNPQRQEQARREVRDLAQEVIRFRRAQNRLATSKAQLSSVEMQVYEAFAVQKIEGSMRASVSVMRDVKSLVNLRELAGTIQQLSDELIKAGIIEEIVGEVLPEDDLAELETDVVEGEVDKVLGELLRDRTATGKLPIAPSAQLPAAATPRKEEGMVEEEDTEEMMDQMRNRLEALRS